MAADVAPGLLRAEAEPDPGAAPAFGFLRWRGHDARCLGRARRRGARAAQRRSEAPRGGAPGAAIRGSDRDARAVKVARDFVKRAGLHGLVVVEQAELESAAPPAARGLLATNAPYGERLAAERRRRGRLPAARRTPAGGLRGGAPSSSPATAGQLRALGLAVRRDDRPAQRPARVRAGVSTSRGRRATGSRRRAAPAPRCVRPRPRARTGDDRRAARRPRTRPRRPPAAGAPAARPQAGAAGPRACSAAAPSTSPTGCARTCAGWRWAAARGDHVLPRLRRRPARVHLVVDVYGEWVHVQEYAPPATVDPRQGEAPAARRARGHRRGPRGAAGATSCSRSGGGSAALAQYERLAAAATSAGQARTTSPTWSTSSTTSTRGSSSTTASRAGWCARWPAAAAS